MMFEWFKGDVDLKEFGGVDSKFRFVLIAALRAKELLKGSKPKIKTKSKNLVRVAQEEVRRGLIDYQLVQPGDANVSDSDDGMYIGEEIGMEGLDLFGGPVAEEPESDMDRTKNLEKSKAMDLEEKMKMALKKKDLPDKIEETEPDFDDKDEAEDDDADNDDFDGDDDD